MGPYIAVLKDSFREARSSRVLWFGLGAVLLFLVALCPLSLEPEIATELQMGELVDPTTLVRSIRDSSEDDVPSPGRHLWKILDDKQRERVTAALDGDAGAGNGSGPARGPRGGFRKNRQIQQGINELLKRDDFYDAEAWADVELDEELTALAGRDDLDATMLASRNRRIMEATWPQYIRTRSDNVYYLNYLGNPIDIPLPLSEEIKSQAVSRVLLGAVQVLLGMIGIFVAVLVTASFVPKMFEPGEITLLLSKPVSRPLLFLTKFAGGCIFILLNAALLLTGLWLIAGFRFGVWNNGLLWCIPVYVFVFAIFYSVSASAGAIWRNAIMAICVTVMFWLVTFLLGVGKTTVEELAINPNRITHVVPAGENLFAVNESKETVLWNSEAGEWDEVFKSDERGGPPRFARRFAFAQASFVPAWDSIGSRIVALEPAMGRFNSGGSSKVIVAREDEGWQRVPAGQSPEPAQELFVGPEGRILLVTMEQVYEFVGQSEETAQAQEWFSRNLGGLIPVRNNRAVAKLLKKKQRWKRPFAVDFDQQTGIIVVMSEGRLMLLGPTEDGGYQIGNEQDLETEGGVLVAVAGGRILVADERGDIRILDSDTLDTLSTHHPFDDVEPRQVAASPTGSQFAVLSHDQQLWLYDIVKDAEVRTVTPHNGDISAAAYDPEGQLFIAHHTTRVSQIASDSSGIVSEFSPAPDLFESIFRYGIKPAWTVLPKPSDLESVVTWLMTEENSVGLDEGFDRSNLQAARTQLDLKTPIWSNLAFLVLLLTCTCIYISRKDF